MRTMIIWLIVFLFPYATVANANGWDKLDRISDEALQLTKNEQLEEAKQLLQYFERQLVLFRDHIPSMDVMYALIATHEEAMKAVTASGVPTEERVNQLTQFRLVVDAVHAKRDPLWKEMKRPVMFAFSKMKEAMERENEDEFEQAFHQFLKQYELIAPSVKINVERERFQRVDAHISLLEAPAFRQLTTTEQVKQLRQMEEDLQALFADGKKEMTAPSLLWVMTSIGGMIIVTLTYVGWRKYVGAKGERAVSSES